MTKTEQAKQAELRRLIEKQAAQGDLSARFVLHGLRTRTNADRAAAVTRWAERSAK